MVSSLISNALTEASVTVTNVGEGFNMNMCISMVANCGFLMVVDGNTTL